MLRKTCRDQLSCSCLIARVSFLAVVILGISINDWERTKALVVEIQG